jgi:hypothetical protein
MHKDQNKSKVKEEVSLSPDKKDNNAEKKSNFFGGKKEKKNVFNPF